MTIQLKFNSLKFGSPRFSSVATLLLLPPFSKSYLMSYGNSFSSKSVATVATGVGKTRCHHVATSRCYHALLPPSGVQNRICRRQSVGSRSFLPFFQPKQRRQVATRI